MPLLTSHCSACSQKPSSLWLVTAVAAFGDTRVCAVVLLLPLASAAPLCLRSLSQTHSRPGAMGHPLLFLTAEGLCGCPGMGSGYVSCSCPRRCASAAGLSSSPGGWVLDRVSEPMRSWRDHRLCCAHGQPGGACPSMVPPACLVPIGSGQEQGLCWILGCLQRSVQGPGPAEQPHPQH